MKSKEYDVIVVGGGHAGCEAALACARMGIKTLLISIRLDTIGVMSCNPAIGGIGKGQLVKEIDALGGEMAKAADYGGIQFRQLNASKGAGARSSRAQEDRILYKSYIQNVLKREAGLELKEDTVIDIVVEDNTAKGVITGNGDTIRAKSVIITAGTFMNGIIHIGLEHFPGGRIGEKSAPEISNALKKLGIRVMSFKTGTCPRLDGRTIDFLKLEKQEGDKYPVPFSFSTTKVTEKQVPCYITYTNPETHKIILSGLDRSPLYTGKIKSTGVRYCPSIEDKLVKFPDRTRHQIFLEPEGLNTHEYYPNGLATSLPEDVQLAFLRSIEGLENVEPTRFGYGIEYDVVDPVQLYPTLEVKTISCLYCAGQVNGTTGYEEAASQGLIAGINAALKIKGENPLILKRPESYIGVLLDDLVTKGTREPYRMFTSRVEYRLLLREDNADARLRSVGHEVGLVKDADYKKTLAKHEKISEIIKHLKGARIKPSDRINTLLAESGLSAIHKDVSFCELLKRPGVGFEILRHLDILDKGFGREIERRVENEIKYEGYIKRQLSEVKRFTNLEKIKIPSLFDFSKIPGLSNEIKEKLDQIRPVSLGQATRISGVTPVAISILMVYLKR